MNKAIEIIKGGYNTLLGLICIAIIVALLSKHFAEAVVLMLLAFVISINQADIEKRIIFGTRASLYKPHFNDLDINENAQISGSYFLSLLFYLGLAFFAVAIAKNLIAAILLLIEAKLIIEQHRENPNQYVVCISHTIPPVIFILLLPESMKIAIILAASGTVLLFMQSIIVINTLAKAKYNSNKIK